MLVFFSHCMLRNGLGEKITNAKYSTIACSHFDGR